MASRTSEQKSQKKVQNIKYVTMYDKIKSVRIGEYDTACVAYVSVKVFVQQTC